PGCAHAVHEEVTSISSDAVGQAIGFCRLPYVREWRATKTPIVCPTLRTPIVTEPASTGRNSVNACRQAGDPGHWGETAERTNSIHVNAWSVAILIGRQHVQELSVPADVNVGGASRTGDAAVQRNPASLRVNDVNTNG